MRVQLTRIVVVVVIRQRKKKNQKSAVIERLTLNFHDIFFFTLENSFFMLDVAARVPSTFQHLAQ